jgi:hypothetical protein
MKWIKYRLLVGNKFDGTELFQYMGLEYSVENEAYIKGIAHNGEYTIEDDGQPEPVNVPSQLDVIEAQMTYTAMMTDTLLEV